MINRRRGRTSGQMEFDFLFGFTVFVVAFIIVINFIPGFLMGLQRSRGVDYDAVAYRTSVILVEDPGQINGVSLPEGIGIVGSLTPPGNNITWARYWTNTSIARFGLSIGRSQPNIISINKVNQFFTYFASNVGDVESKLLFPPPVISRYGYVYSISIRNISPMPSGMSPLTYTVGTMPYPSTDYGYVRRYVMIKQNPSVNLNLAARKDFNITNPAQVVIQDNTPDGSEQFTVQVNGGTIYNKSIDLPYNLDLQTEPLIIHISNLKSVLNNSAIGYNPGNPLSKGSFLSANFTGITLTDQYGQDWTTREPWILYADGLQWNGTPRQINQTLDFTAYPDSYVMNNLTTLNVNFKFNDWYKEGQGSSKGENQSLPNPQIFFGGIELYDYNRVNVTQPDLTSAMLEVGIW